MNKRIQQHMKENDPAPTVNAERQQVETQAEIAKGKDATTAANAAHKAVMKGDSSQKAAC